ncbi:hypothetical protein [Limnohabitans sp. Jir72]|uniref:hypothetical protein n=1 Tax=Limnohabitans sp. Jir72 TaxID=1977909 RepID=UPI0011B20A73|nr:hypothetical protein [Limnohabitans sp. Jir72]
MIDFNFFCKEILVVIANYDFSSNASILKNQFSKFMPTILIDGGSLKPPPDFDFLIENTYYPGLFNSAVSLALKENYKYLMFVASDVEINDVKSLCYFSIQSLKNEKIAVYSPSVTHESRTAYPLLINKNKASLREVGVVEGFFFLCKTDILKKIYPIPKDSKFGWGFDLLMCHHAYEAGDIVVVDDRLQIFHPASIKEHIIDNEYANNEMFKFVTKKIFEESIERMLKISEASQIDKK